MNKFAVLSDNENEKDPSDWEDIDKNDNSLNDEDVFSTEDDTTNKAKGNLCDNELQGLDPAVIAAELLLDGNIMWLMLWLFSFIYASNVGKQRLLLWKELHVHATITNNLPWVLMGDFNVTRALNEHSSGCSMLSNEMKDFNDCVNDIEVEDIGSSGFHYTWTKSLRNPQCNTLKKLDRILCNEDFINTYHDASGTFMPYLVSDHNPAILYLPKGSKKKKKSFMFMNHIARKDEFLPIVVKGWNVIVNGYKMYQVVTKMKLLKKDLKNLNWSNGNVFDKVNDLRVKLKKCQADIDSYPHDMSLRNEASSILKQYESAKVDELILLQQKAKLHWLTSSTFLGHNGNCRPIEDLGDIFTKKLTSLEAKNMVTPITDDEVKTALFDIDDNKASSPDGYSPVF
ncbi:uncharacterized protein [Rutidosis leptorrhynchoides]|uniref:uncharacterized protein n=1 Tax=Rutidosis leptorrhynchoides TaxID=125765 RepID=UPI003A993C26